MGGRQDLGIMEKGTEPAFPAGRSRASFWLLCQVATMSDEDEKKTIQSQLEEQAEKSAASRTSTTESQLALNEIEAKLASIQGALDQIKDQQGSERETEASRRKLHQKVLKDFKDKQERKKGDEK